MESRKEALNVSERFRKEGLFTLSISPCGGKTLYECFSLTDLSGLYQSESLIENWVKDYLASDCGYLALPHIDSISIFIFITLIYLLCRPGSGGRTQGRSCRLWCCQTSRRPSGPREGRHTAAGRAGGGSWPGPGPSPGRSRCSGPSSGPAGEASWTQSCNSNSR